MSELIVIDTFAEFLQYWGMVQNQTINQQIESWYGDYMSQWPELRALQIDNYQDKGYGWREIARKYVFKDLPTRVERMKEARANLQGLIPWVFQRVKDTCQIDFDIIFVVYVGIGMGAGRASEYKHLPACLLGLENIAEEHWQGKDSLKGLLAHETGHLIHQQARGKHGLPALGTGPLWDIYEEGLAQRYEHLILGSDTWHQQNGQPDWLQWCQHNQSWLATEFLNSIGDEERVRRFFGSWFNVKGYKECGYYLGHQVIKELERDYSLNKIAVFPAETVDPIVKKVLRQFAGKQ